jgi:3-oxoadipate enol-lactonase
MIEVQVPGGSLVAEVSGMGAPVVLVHTGLSDRRMWTSVAGLLEQSLTVGRFDMRGFGESSVPHAPFRHVDDLLAVLHQLALGSVHLVGASYGGKVALEFAASHTDRLASLVLLAPLLPGSDWSPAMRAYGNAEEDALQRGDLDAAIELNLQVWVRGSARAWSDETRVVADEIRASLRVALTNQPSVEEHELDAEAPVRELLHRIDTPTLVVVGEADVGDFVTNAEYLAGHIPGAELTRLPDTGHLIALERPHETAILVTDFVAERGAGPR